MKISLILGAVLSATLLGGCSGSTTLTTANSPIVSSSTRTAGPPVATPPVRVTTPPIMVLAAKRWRPGIMQYGVQLYWHGINPDARRVNSDVILDYLVKLGANSVGITFPIYTDGARPTHAYATAETPTPAQLDALVAKAKARGLRVTIRPLIDEANIMITRNQWRGSIRPLNLQAWFTSYWTVLRPYLQVAQSAKAEEVVLGTELSSLQDQTSEWRRLLTSSHDVYGGILSYGVNWDGISSASKPFVHQTIDLYPPVALGDSASVQQLTVALTNFLNRAPGARRRDMTIQEVGIPAISGMYPHPWLWGASAHSLNLGVQAKWFTAACNAVKQSGVAGLYYWMIDSNVNPLTVSPGSLPPFSFIGRPSETSIRSCFS